MAKKNKQLIRRESKILLVVPRYQPNVTKNYNYMFPLGLGYISACLKKTGYLVDGLNLNHFEGQIKDILTKKLDEKKYDFVCTGGNALGYSAIEKIINISKEHSSKPKFILGGPIITTEPELVARDLNIDYGVIDEGDESIIELIDCLENKGDVKGVKGVIYYDENRNPIISGIREPPKNLDGLPFADLEGLGYEEWLDNQIPNFNYMESIFDNPRILPFVGSRSCPYQCTFCYHYNNRYRARSIESIMNELDLVVKKYKINRIYLFDECFSVNRERTIEFCKRMTELRKELSWDLRWIPTMRVDFIDKKLLKIMKNSGCDIISYGFESYSRSILESMKKRITPEQIDKAIKDTLDTGIALQGNFIFGDSEESKESAYETLNYWKEHCKGQVHLSFIRPYPNSAIYQHCIKKGLIVDRLKFIKSIMGRGDFYMNLSDKMTNEEMSKLRNDVLNALADYRKVVEPLHTKKTSLGIYDLVVECPFCGEVMKYKNFHIDNIYNYGYGILCKKCPMRFHVASKLRKFAYKNFVIAKRFNNLELKINSLIGSIKQ